MIRHELYQDNVANLEAGIAALEEGSRCRRPMTNILGSVDWAWYYMNFGGPGNIASIWRTSCLTTERAHGETGLLSTQRHCDVRRRYN